jgi:hypothetical protein
MKGDGDVVVASEGIGKVGERHGRWDRGGKAWFLGCEDGLNDAISGRILTPEMPLAPVTIAVRPLMEGSNVGRLW